MQFMNFTLPEIRALLFLLVALLIGSGITLYKRSHPQFAPELVVEKNDLAADSGRQKVDQLSEKPARKKINLNHATALELELIPGIGPKLSQRIVDYRKTNGEFQKLEDLIKVPGIGPKNFEQIKDYLTIE